MGPSTGSPWECWVITLRMTILVQKSWPISACVLSCRGLSLSESCQGPCHASCAPVCVVPSQRSRCCCSLDAQAARKARRGRPCTSLVGQPLCIEREEPGSTVALKCFLACGWMGEGSRGSGARRTLVLVFLHCLLYQGL